MSLGAQRLAQLDRYYSAYADGRVDAFAADMYQSHIWQTKRQTQSTCN